MIKGWLRVYYGLDLLLSKLSEAQVAESSGERHNNQVVNIVAPYTVHTQKARYHQKG